MAKREILRRGKTERVKLERLGDQNKKRAEPNRITFTDLGIRRLKPPKDGQRLYWDQAQKGLSLLVSSGGTKTFRSQFKLNGKWLTRSLGRFGEMKANDNSENVNVTTARDIARNDRALALDGTDPRKRQEEQPASKFTYEAIVDQFIEKYAKPRQRTWDQTERTLKGSKAEQKSDEGIAEWLDRPIASITKTDAYNLLDGMIAEKRGPKARITLAWLRTLWKWAYKRDIVADPIMEKVEIDVARRKRTKVFDDDAIKATWHAANKLGPVESAYVKLLILLAPRKSALTGMRRSHLSNLEDSDKALWTTPPELVKQPKCIEEENDEPREYYTPLPGLAVRIIKSIPKHEGENSNFIFPSRTSRGVALSPTGPLTIKLVKAGAPADFGYHAWRHTLASWFKQKGYDKFDRGLLLNHAESGVTAGYSHGYAKGRKRKLLEKWAYHVAGLVQPEGIALLR